jgi:outer membrane biosynthesis protein TonB
MEYSKIIAITGLPGLYELISSKSDGGIVRSLEDKSTRFVSSRVHQFSHLESIEVYTKQHNENLVTILKAMESSKEKLPDDKDPKSLISYFEKVYPDLDHTRVYTSDLKKMVKWFAVLQVNQIEIKLSEPVAAEVEKESAVEEKPEVKPVKKVVKAKEKEKEPEVKKPVKKAVKAKEEEKEPEVKKPVKKASAVKKSPEKSKKKAPAKKAAAPKSKGEKKSTGSGKSKKPAAKKKTK